MQQESLFPRHSEESKERAERQIIDNRNEFAWGIREWSIETILEKFGEDGSPDSSCELYIPDYQRDYKWPLRIASRFIESILMGFPIPYLYIATVEDFENQDQDGRVEIIDGSQRIRALNYFVKNQFALTDLKELKDLEGFYFKDLLPGRQRKFKRESLRLIELKCDTDGDYRRNLFERINSGFKPLIPMEVRKGSVEAVSKFYKDILIPCSQNSTFRSLAPLSQSRRSNEDYSELVLRFFAYSQNLEEYKGDVKQFLDSYFNTKSSEEDIDITLYIRRFEEMLQFVNDKFPNGFKKTNTAKTVSRTYFEAIAVGVRFALDECSNKDALDTDSIQHWITGLKFKEIVTSDAANNTSKLKNRINFVKNKLLGNEEPWMNDEHDYGNQI